MSDQQYVYTTHELSDRAMADMEAILNEYAREGWRLSETIERKGTTTGLLFEREV